MIFEGIRISGIGRYIPEDVLTNKQLENICETNSKWIFDNLGISERHVGDSVVDMGLHALDESLLSAGVAMSSLGAIIVSTSSPEKLAPSVAAQIVGFWGVEIPAFDINAVCSGFVYGLNLACCMIAGGGYDNVAVVATERYSAITDWGDRNCVYFGDGAGAVIVSRGNGKITVNINANGKSQEAFNVKVGGKIQMKGRMVRDNAAIILPKAIKATLDEANLDISCIDYLVPHQPSIKILQSLASSVHISFDKVVTVMDKYANIASASIPIALYEITPIEDKKILLAAIGSGWTWGTAIIEQ